MANNVTVYNEKGEFVYEGDYDVSVSPAAVLIVTEAIPDVSNMNDGKPMAKIKALYNASAWDMVDLDD